MSLLQYQNIVSRITTLKKERISFFEDRNRYLQNYSLSDLYKKKLLALDSLQIQEFSNGLIRKRWGVVKKLLFLSHDQVSILASIYFDYAEEIPSKGKIYKHQFDAYYFADFLLKKKKLKLDTDLIKQIKNRKLVLQKYLIEEQQLKKNSLRLKNLFII